MIERVSALHTVKTDTHLKTIFILKIANVMSEWAR